MGSVAIFCAYTAFVFNHKTFAICTLDDFLNEFSASTLQFELEIKVPGIEQKVVDTVRYYDIQQRTVITSFQWECIENVRLTDYPMRTGYLVDAITPEILAKIQEFGVYEVCPVYSSVTKDEVDYCHSLGIMV